MKKFKLFGLAALVLLLLCSLTGCPTDDGGGDNPEKMIFEDITKRFTFNENLGFEVLFKTEIKLFEGIPGMEITLPKNTKVTGTIESTNDWTDNPVIGTVKKIDSNNKGIKAGLGSAVGLPLSVAYGYDADSEIDSVTVAFITTGITDPETLGFIVLCDGVIGGSYTRN